MENAKPKQIHKTKPKPTLTCKNCSRACVYHCVQLSYTTQHRTVLIIFSLILQTIIIAQMKSTGTGMTITLKDAALQERESESGRSTDVSNENGGHVTIGVRQLEC